MPKYQQLRQLLQSKDSRKFRLASLLGPQESDWTDLLNHYPEMSFLAAQNPHLPSCLADRLAKHPNPSVRLMVARHGNLSFEALQNLVDDPEAAVRLALAKRADLDQQFASQLLEDKDPAVGLAVARYQPPTPSFSMAMGW